MLGRRDARRYTSTEKSQALFGMVGVAAQQLQCVWNHVEDSRERFHGPGRISGKIDYQRLISDSAEAAAESR
jgi:hypothetical protein